MHVDVVLPCLDEAAALPWILERMPTSYRAIVADNGSTDRSAQIARHLGATVIEVAKRGYGAACHAGVLAATSPIVCVMDADATLDPSDLPPLVQRLQDDDADLVLGRRRATSLRAHPLHARLGNAALVALLRRRGITGLHDVAPMRVAKRSRLLALDVRDRGFGYPLELLLRAGQAGYRMVEHDVAYHPRIGHSKVTGSLRGTLRTIRDMRRVLGA